MPSGIEWDRQDMQPCSMPCRRQRDTLVLSLLCLRPLPASSHGGPGRKAHRCLAFRVAENFKLVFLWVCSACLSVQGCPCLVLPVSVYFLPTYPPCGCIFCRSQQQQSEGSILATLWASRSRWLPMGDEQGPENLTSAGQHFFHFQ